MANLTNEDLRFVVTRLPKDVRRLIKDYNLFIGGGFIRETIAGGEVKDIDLFGSSDKVLSEAAKQLNTDREGSRSHSTDNAITLLNFPRLPVQFITRWVFSDPVSLVNSFDFTVCQAVIYLTAEGNWKSEVSDSFYSDLSARRLTYTYPKREEDAGGSMLRVRKFLQRGYNIQAESLAGVIARIVGGSVNAKTISDKLREVDPLAIVDGVEAIDEHEIINQ